ncbi:Nuclear transcription factor Y subunit B-4 [Triticum urartu]|uniref:Nuclear transcription factor Y subunit B-4 n=1 Tax=Triticum urartu TaxID=4572 RepID=M8A4C7_TRIUA|nr:Nuclear transcription factor Y subunit B-4 [Triticum urartu]
MARSNTSGAPWGDTADFFSSPRRVLFLRVVAAGAGCALLAPAEDDEGEDAEAGEGGGGGGLRLVAIRWARVTCALKNKRGDMVSRSGTSTLVCDPGRRRASDKCVKEKRKTINGDDLIWSMGTLGFEDYVEPLKLHLKLYQQAFEFKRLLLYYDNAVLFRLAMEQKERHCYFNKREDAFVHPVRTYPEMCLANLQVTPTLKDQIREAQLLDTMVKKVKHDIRAYPNTSANALMTKTFYSSRPDCGS